MWVFLGRWIRRYLLVAVALPIAGRLLGAIGQRAERRTGPTWRRAGCAAAGTGCRRGAAGRWRAA